MARTITGFEFNGSSVKKVKKGQKNKIHIKGSGLQLNAGQTLTITKMKSQMVSGSTVLWTVDSTTITVDGAGKHIKFDSSLPSFAAIAKGKAPTDKAAKAQAPTGGDDLGDITITLEYSGEPDLPATCEDVEHEP